MEDNVPCKNCITLAICKAKIASFRTFRIMKYADIYKALTLAEKCSKLALYLYNSKSILFSSRKAISCMEKKHE